MYKRKIAADLLKCGASRVKILDTKAVDEALTRQDIRNLIRKGVIVKIQKKGTTRAAAKIILRQKKKGRRSGAGKRKGGYKTRNPKKEIWMTNIRSLRSSLKKLRDSNQIEQSDYRKLYLRLKGGSFRSKKQFMNYLKEHELLKPREKVKAKKTAPKKKT